MIDQVRTNTASKHFHHSRQFYFILINAEGACLYINPLLSNQYGLTAGGEGYPFSSLIRSSEKTKYTATLKRCLANPGQPVSVELIHQLPADFSILIRWEFQALMDEMDKPDIIQLVGTALKQVRQDKKMEDEKIRSDHERYKAYELGAEAIWRLELEIPAIASWSPEELIRHCRQYGYIAECNDNMAEMYGLAKSADLVGMKLDNIMNLEDPRQAGMFHLFIENGFSIKNAESEEHDVNGRKLFFMNNMTGIIEEGMLTRIWGTQQDITQKKKAEEERLRSELFYRNLIADALDGILLTDINGIISFASPSIEQILGYRPDDLLHTAAFDYVHPEDRALALAAFADEVKMEPITKFIDIRLKTKYGGWLYCNVRGHNMLYNPYIGRMAVYFHDDSRRKEVEDKLRESEQRFRQLINNMRTGVLLKDKNEQVLICNKAACDLLGLTEDQLMGRDPIDPDWNVIRENGSDFPADAQPVAMAIRTKKTVKDVNMGVYHPQTGERVWLLVNAEPILDNNGEIIHIICSMTDISEQKKFAKQLINQEIQKQKMLTRATIDGQEKERKEIGKELHDNISQHLSTTRLYLEVALEKSNGQVQEMIRHAYQSVAEVIGEIRQLSQSLVPPTLGDIGLVESVEDICNALRRTYKFSVDFDYRYFTERHLFDNMKLMLFRIIQEQVNNIIRHSGANLVRIQLQSGEDNVLLEIIDNGKGFDPSDIKKGLGLTNMTNRASLFNGRLEISSAPGKGCHMTVVLPLK